MKPINDRMSDPLIAVPPQTTSGAITGTKVNGTGSGRARFVFSFGANSGTSGALSTGAGIWNAATSGGTFTQITGASLAAVTSGVLSNVTMVIDTVIDSAKPWLQVSGLSITSSITVLGATVEFYSGTRRLPPTSTAQQVVIV